MNMAVTNWQKGQVVAHKAPKVLAEDLIEPEWYVLVSKPMRERLASRWLEDAGAAEVWFPTEKIWQKLPQNRGKRQVDRMIAPRYLFTCFLQRPIWHEIFENCGWLSGVVGINVLDVFGADGSITRHMVSLPVPVKQSELADMRQVPTRMAELNARAIEEIRAARDALVPQPGEKVKLIEGPFEGYIVDVAFVEQGVVHYLLDLPVGRVEGQSDISAIDRNANSS